MRLPETFEHTLINYPRLLTFPKSHTDAVRDILKLNIHRFAGRQILERPNVVRLDVIVRLEVAAVVVVVIAIAMPGIIQHLIQMP